MQSLAVGHCEAPGCSRITMVVPGTDSGVANLIKQLLKLIYVQKVCCRQLCANLSLACQMQHKFQAVARQMHFSSHAGLQQSGLKLPCMRMSLGLRGVSCI